MPSPDCRCSRCRRSSSATPSSRTCSATPASPSAACYAASNHDDLRRLGAIVTHLDRHELGLYPRLLALSGTRLVLAYVRRWRETVVYAQALWLLKVRKLPIWLVEEAILKRSG